MIHSKMKLMNKITLLVAILIIGFTQAQIDIKNWRNLTSEQRRELVNKMSPDEKVHFLKQFRENLMMDELNLPDEKQEEFKNLYNEYQESQRQIKDRFKSNINYENMSDEEAKRELEQSFVVGQQLLDNNRKYAEKFQRVMKPQQVLQLFQNEGRIRNKMIDRRKESRDMDRDSNTENSRQFRDRSRSLQENRSTPQFRNNESRNNNGGMRAQPQSRRP